MLIHLFGGVWLPSCASFSLLKTAEDSDQFDAARFQTVQDNFYVDDCLKSSRCKESFISFSLAADVT